MIPEVTFDYFDIELVLSGEIYAVVLKFMDELYRSGRIQDFSFIKLTALIFCRRKRTALRTGT